MTALILGELALALAAGLMFVALYALRSPWRTSEMGRHLMAFMVVTAAELGSLLALGLGWHVPLWLFAVGFGALDVVVVQRVWLLVKAQRSSTRS
jgi:N-acetylglutamate synthase-like GNAT family acetyltransferase